MRFCFVRAARPNTYLIFLIKYKELLNFSPVQSYGMINSIVSDTKGERALKSRFTLKRIGLCLFILTMAYVCFSPAALKENCLGADSCHIRQEDVPSHYIQSPEPVIPSITYDYFRLVQQNAVNNSILSKFVRSEKPVSTVIPLIFIIQLLFSLYVIGRPYDWLYPYLPSIPFLEALKIIHKKDGRLRNTCIY